MPSKRVAALVLASAVGLTALWIWMAKWMPGMVQETPLEEFSRRHAWSPALGEPSIAWVAIALAGLTVIAWLIAGRRPVVDAFASLTSTTFLLLGLWLPVASRSWCSATSSDYLDAEYQLAHPIALFGWIVVLPVAAAAVITHFEARLSRRVIRIGIAIGLTCAIASRHGAEVATTRCIGRVPAVDCPSLVFVSFVHMIVVAALVACAALLGLAMTRRSRPCTAYAAKRYLAFFAIASIPDLIAIDQSFDLVEHLLRLVLR